ncbi:MAG: cation-transporting P-type ATPase [Pseudomonadales bacterium]|nr:cation-transporting P-type ATPase [Pseudomonadales bacterium]
MNALRTGTEGLSEKEAAARLEFHGGNWLPEPGRPHPILRLLLQFHNILIYVLLGSAAITAALGHLVDTLVILAVVLINGLIGFAQEGKAEKAMDAVRRLLAVRASVLRDGERRTVDGSSLVPGDIVILEAGDKVPADLRLYRARGLQVQEAILTGESVPVDKHVEPVEMKVPMGDRACMAYSGTLVTSGLGRGVVVSTGTATEIGRISGMLSGVEVLTTPLVRQMNVFARWLTLVILLIAAALLVFGYRAGQFAFSELFMAVVGLSVAAIPEGLPAVLTITLAVGVQAMAKRNAIVRHLPAIETLGSVSVICTDKTGTLTRNEMMVVSVVTEATLFSLEGEGYTPRGAITLDGTVVSVREHEILEEIGRAAVLCNDASLIEIGGVWQVEGDPMEGALLTLAGRVDMDYRAQRREWTRTDTIPFDSQHRLMATLNHDHEGHAFIIVKGAPEQILSMCREQRTASGGTQPLDPDYWTARGGGIAAQGQRVLALAVKSVTPEHTVLKRSDTEADLTLIALVGFLDPPRVEAIAAVAECTRAGIRVKMVTGDHKATAAAIGQQIGLQNPSSALTGEDIDAMDDAKLRSVVLETDIFARTSPGHKLRLVMALQAHGLTVAMTGDGVNDAPALKRADAGIAMGLKGSEAAKDASDLVLTDDNFASIVAAVREGRTVYDNIKKVISWTLPTSAGEAMTIIVALLLGMTLPITPIQILWINLATAITLGLALAFEPTEAGTMYRSPRPRNEPLLSAELGWHIVLVSALFLGSVFGIYSFAIDRGFSVELARTMALNTLVVMEIFHLFFVRNMYGTSLTWKGVRGTRVVWATVVCVSAAQFSITYLPPLQRIFQTESVPLFAGALIVAIGVGLFSVLEVEKQVRLRLRNRRAVRTAGR